MSTRLFTLRDHIQEDNKKKFACIKGTLVPWALHRDGEPWANHKIICSDGVEYYLVTDEGWSETLIFLEWGSVRAYGILKKKDNVLELKSIVPSDPDGGKMVPVEAGGLTEQMQRAYASLQQFLLVPASLTIPILAS